jgi:hypothetical protein
MKLERKNLSPPFATSAALHQLERTMLASIALMKRLRRQHRRVGNVDADMAVRTGLLNRNIHPSCSTERPTRKPNLLKIEVTVFEASAPPSLPRRHLIAGGLAPVGRTVQ